MAQMTTWRGSSNQKARKEPRVIEPEGQERARLGAAVPELAGGVPCLGPRMKPARRAESEELARRFFEAAAGGDVDALPGMRCLIWRDCQVRYARAPARDFTGATARVKRDPGAIPA